MSDIFEEIDDDLKQDKVFQWWKKYNRPLIAAIVIVVLAMGAWLAWTNFQQSKAQAAGDRLNAAIDAREDGDIDAAASELAELIGAGGAYGMIAAFQLADLEAGRGNTAAAVAALDGVQGASRYEELAGLMKAFYQLDDADSGALKSQLEGLTGGDATFANNARELLAVVALREGDEAAARQQLNALVEDEDVAASIKSRARELLSTLPAETE